MGVRLSVSPRELGPVAAGARPDDAVYEFDQGRILIGRGAGADVSLPHRSVSARHATIEQQRGRYVIVDHGTTNGTRVNGARLVPERPKPLRDGDRIEVGAFALGWKEGIPVASIATAERTASLARRLLRDVLGDRAPRGARLVIANGPRAGTELAIPEPPARLVLGRAETCDLVIEDADASREHIDLVIDLDGVIARDRGSKNGLIVNERALAEKRLVDRDELLVGATVLVFEDLESIAMRETEQSPDEAIPDPPTHGVGARTTGSDGAPIVPADDPEAPTGEPDADHATDRGPGAASDDVAPASSAAGTTGPRVGSPPSPVAPRRAAISAVELLIYVLAAIVLAASIAGLVLLLRTE